MTTRLSSNNIVSVGVTPELPSSSMPAEADPEEATVILATPFPECDPCPSVTFPRIVSFAPVTVSVPVWTVRQVAAVPAPTPISAVAVTAWSTVAVSWSPEFGTEFQPLWVPPSYHGEDGVPLGTFQSPALWLV